MWFKSKRFDSGQFFRVSFFNVDTLSFIFNYGMTQVSEKIKVYVVSAFINKQIAFEGRFLVIGGNARLEAAVGGLDIAVAVVDTDDDGISVVVVHEIHIVSFLPHSGDTKNFDGWRAQHLRTSQMNNAVQPFDSKRIKGLFYTLKEVIAMCN